MSEATVRISRMPLIVFEQHYTTTNGGVSVEIRNDRNCEARINRKIQQYFAKKAGKTTKKKQPRSKRKEKRENEDKRTKAQGEPSERVCKTFDTAPAVPVTPPQSRSQPDRTPNQPSWLQSQSGRTVSQPSWLQSQSGRTVSQPSSARQPFSRVQVSSSDQNQANTRPPVIHNIPSTQNFHRLPPVPETRIRPERPTQTAETPPRPHKVPKFIRTLCCCLREDDAEHGPSYSRFN